MDKIEEVALLPCPFCGGDGPCLQEEGDGYAQVICVCTATGPLRKGEEAAIEAWNTRAQAAATIHEREMSERVGAAWREGWALCKASLSDDEQFCLTEDVEEDAWLDSKARAALQPNRVSEGDGDLPPLWKLDVGRDVQIAKWGLAALLTLVGLFFWLVYMPDTKSVQKDISDINSNVAGQSSTLNAMNASLGRIEDRLDDDHAEASSGAGQTGAVHRGTGGKHSTG